MVLLVSSDNQQFHVDKEVAERSAFIGSFLEDVDEPVQPIPLPNVPSTVLEKVLEYCEHHRGEPLPSAESESTQNQAHSGTIDIGEWDQQFVTVNQEMLSEITRAANYLDIKPLLDVCCRAVAKMMQGKTPKEIHKLFKIEGDFMPKREAQIRENAGAED